MTQPASIGGVRLTLALAASLLFHFMVAFVPIEHRLLLPVRVEEYVEIEVFERTLRPMPKKIVPEPIAPAVTVPKKAGVAGKEKAGPPDKVELPAHPEPVTAEGVAELDRASTGLVAIRGLDIISPRIAIETPEREIWLPEPDTYRPETSGGIPVAEPLEGVAQPSEEPTGSIVEVRGGTDPVELAKSLLSTVKREEPARRTFMTKGTRTPFEIGGEVGRDREVHSFPALPDVDIKSSVTVEIEFAVTPSGEVVRTIPTRRGDPVLDEATLEYARNIKFNPLPAGKTGEQRGTMRVKYELE